MFSPSRRTFLGASLAALASPRLFGADPVAELAKLTDDPVFQPSTLFLTWQRDPTTTMTVQWVGVKGETADTKVYYSPTASGPFEAKPTTVMNRGAASSTPGMAVTPSTMMSRSFSTCAVDRR